MRGSIAIRWLLLLVLAAPVTAAELPATMPDELRMVATGVSQMPLRVRVWLPPDYAATQARYDVLYVNDGQDMQAVGMVETLERLYARHAITRIIVVAIDMPPDRMAGYGLFDRATGKPIIAPTAHGSVGTNAHAYASWLTQALVPAIDARYRTRADASGRALLGWSLGALSAFGIGWQHPELFGRVGAFSPSFWLATDRTDARSVQATRIVHRLVDESIAKRRAELFFAVGTREETEDRDGDGVIDVLDDTRELLDAMPATQATLLLLEGGRHDQQAWARMLPNFLQWAYGPAGTDPRPH